MCLFLIKRNELKTGATEQDGSNSDFRMIGIRVSNVEGHFRAPKQLALIFKIEPPPVRLGEGLQNGPDAGWFSSPP